MPKAAAAAENSMDLRSPSLFTTRAAGMSAITVPIITNPAIIAAWGIEAPSASALAGIIGTSAYSPVENRAEGMKTGAISDEIWYLSRPLAIAQA